MANVARPGAQRDLRADREMLEALQRVTDATLAYLPHDELLRELLVRISEVLGSDTAAILLLDAQGEFLHPRAAKGLEEQAERGIRIPVGGGFAGRIAAERRPITIEDVDHAEILNPILRASGIRSLLGVPLLVEDRVLGVLHVGSLERRIFSARESDLLQLAADRAALAIEHASLFEQRVLAEALQRRLLPVDLSGTGGLEIASRYLPASQASVGGDWYDAFPLGGGRVALVVGDVVGHDVAAAATMAQLRTALRAYAVDGHAPSAVLDRVNRLMCELGPAAMTTLAYVVVDPAGETIEFVGAGHPPPLVVARDGSASYLPLSAGIPLGVAPGETYEASFHPFASGSAVVLYTDGLVEARGSSIDRGLERLRTLAAGATSLERLCDDVVAHMIPGERSDDVAMIAARVPPTP